MKKLKDLDNNLELWHSETIAWTPALTLFLKVYAETIDRGLGLNQIHFKNSNRVVWIQNSEKVVLGGICYEYSPENQMGWIVLSFTDPSYRGQGVNSLCHQAFEDDCKSLGAISIGSTVSVGNESRLKSAAKVGLLPKFYRMYKKI